MEEQATWKAHTFTLLVFTGIVVLVSIFFILGMLVGRAQGQKIASNPPVAASAKVDIQPEPKQDKPDFTFYDSVKKEQTAALQPAPPADPPIIQERPPKPAAAAETREKPAKNANVVNYQIGAVKKSSDAEKLLTVLKKKGFRAFILAPTADDPKQLYRVQVGPFSDPVEAQQAKQKLETAGYQALLKK